MLPEDFALALVAYGIWYLGRRLDQERSAKAQAKIQFESPLVKGFANSNRNSIRPGGIKAPYHEALGLRKLFYPEIAVEAAGGGLFKHRADQEDWVWKKMQKDPGFQGYIDAIQEREDPEFLVMEAARGRQATARAATAAEAQRLRDVREISEDDLNKAVENYKSMINDIMVNLNGPNQFKIKEIALVNNDQSELSTQYATMLQFNLARTDKIRLVECTNPVDKALYYIDFGYQLVGTNVVDVPVLDLPLFKKASNKMDLGPRIKVYVKMIKVKVFDTIIKKSVERSWMSMKKKNQRGDTARKLAGQLADGLDGT